MRLCHFVLCISKSIPFSRLVGFFSSIAVGRVGVKLHRLQSAAEVVVLPPAQTCSTRGSDKCWVLPVALSPLSGLSQVFLVDVQSFAVPGPLCKINAFPVSGNQRSGQV